MSDSIAELRSAHPAHLANRERVRQLWRAASWYARHGWRVFPCIPGQKTPAIKAWQRRATTDLPQIGAWWSQAPYNIGLACGPDSGIYVLDVDQHGVADGEAALAACEKKWGALDETIEQLTGGGGRQLLFAWPEGTDLRNKCGTARKSRNSDRTILPAGLDSRGNGGYVVVPPSLHPSGEFYRWRDGCGPHERWLAPMSARWVRELARKPEPITISVPVPRLEMMDRLGRETVERICAYLGSRQEGDRNAHLYWAAKKLAAKAEAGVVVWLEAERALWSAARACGLGAEETARTIKSGLDHSRNAA